MPSSSDGPFSDRLPFKNYGPDYVSHLGMARSGEEQEQHGTVTGDAEERSALAGRPAEYRLVFQSMEVPGLPERFMVGRVQVFQTDGPVWTQHTHITQRPGWRPVYEKWMDHQPVGTGYRLTVCVLPVTLTEEMSESLLKWRDEVLAALSFAVALLDERIAQVELAEDVITTDDAPGSETHVFDTRVRLREFTPASRVLSQDRQVLDQFAALDTATESPVLAAGRWYLRAAQSGPTADAIVFLWIALEALSKPAWGTKLLRPEKRRTDVEWAEEAVAATGFDVSRLNPDIGRLSGLRAEIVHGGVEAPALLRPGYYTLEAVVRLLLKARLNTGEAGWALRPGIPNLRSPLRQLALIGHNFRRIAWRAKPPEQPES